MLHLVGILFPHINDDARSKSHQICIGHTFNKEQLVVMLGKFHKDQEGFIVVEMKFCG